MYPPVAGGTPCACRRAQSVCSTGAAAVYPLQAQVCLSYAGESLVRVSLVAQVAAEGQKLAVWRAYTHTHTPYTYLIAGRLGKASPLACI